MTGISVNYSFNSVNLLPPPPITPQRRTFVSYLAPLTFVASTLKDIIRKSTVRGLVLFMQQDDGITIRGEYNLSK